MLRIGNGIDFHKLTIDKERPLILGGYTIESDYALVGHSDADVILHAISDAILGALSLGDIGQYFPDTDMSLKNMDSKVILLKCLELMDNKGYEILNVDTTLLGEKPRISKYRSQIQNSLARLLSIPEDCVSIKATTTEKMGAIGREEGVAVFSTILLQKKNYFPIFNKII